jgi:hypothetical protein
MSDEIDQFRVKVVANEYLLSAAIIRLSLLDPEFTRDARQWFDHILGAFSASELSKPFPPKHVSTLREQYMHLVDRVEAQARLAIQSRGSKPKSLRRRIFEWLERG